MLNWSGGMSLPWQSGQSGQASPEPVVRTTEPTTMSPNMSVAERNASRAVTRKSRAEGMASRQVNPGGRPARGRVRRRGQRAHGSLSARALGAAERQRIGPTRETSIFLGPTAGSPLSRRCSDEYAERAVLSVPRQAGEVGPPASPSAPAAGAGGRHGGAWPRGRLLQALARARAAAPRGLHRRRNGRLNAGHPDRRAGGAP